MLTCVCNLRVLACLFAKRNLTVQQAATVLHKYHPDAEVWVSAQEFNASALSSFFNIIGTAAVREYLHGVVVGPHWSIPTAEIVKRMPPGYALRQYPDICHPRGAQYAIADWHWGWQATAGRQMINPMYEPPANV